MNSCTRPISSTSPPAPLVPLRIRGVTQGHDKAVPGLLVGLHPLACKDGALDIGPGILLNDNAGPLAYVAQQLGEWPSSCLAAQSRHLRMCRHRPLSEASVTGSLRRRGKERIEKEGQGYRWPLLLVHPPLSSPTLPTSDLLPCMLPESVITLRGSRVPCRVESRAGRRCAAPCRCLGP